MFGASQAAQGAVPAPTTGATFGTAAQHRAQSRSRTRDGKPECTTHDEG